MSERASFQKTCELRSPPLECNDQRGGHWTWKIKKQFSLYLREWLKGLCPIGCYKHRNIIILNYN